MHNFISFAQQHNIELIPTGPCQFCGAAVTRGVIECHENTHHLAEILDFNNPAHYQTRFISVDAMALQHCELHGPWNNHIHLTRLFLIFEKGIVWDYSKTPQLSQVINAYKKDKTNTLLPPPPQQRGAVTSYDIVQTKTVEETIQQVHAWGQSVYRAFENHHEVIIPIATTWLEKFYK